MPASIRIAAVALIRGGDILLVRKRGSRRFMLPGGKYAPGESARDCAVREVEEEIGVRLAPADLDELSEFSAPAANEPGRQVSGRIFVTAFAGEARARAEIEDVVWRPVGGDGPDLAPLLRLAVLPALRLRGG